MRYLFVLLVACGASAASIEHDAQNANDRAYAKAIADWQSKHPNAHELPSHYVENPALVEPSGKFAMQSETHELVIEEAGCGQGCHDCDLGARPSFRVFATGDSFTLVRMTPKVHTRTVKSDECDPGCGHPMFYFTPPKAYPVQMPAKLEVVDVPFAYEQVAIERELCPGPPPP